MTSSSFSASARSAAAPLPTLPPAYRAADANRLLRLGVWAYFMLLLFEGALRKWFLPGLSTPLLIIRDPIALWLLLSVWKRGILPANGYLMGMVVIGVAGIFTATLLGHGNLMVALFGARILLLHFPLVFVIGRVFYREDVVRMGKVLLWIAMPMTVLLTLQLYSPQSAWVNRGVGGDMAGAGFSGAGDFLRPPGTFSFINGVALFYGLVAPFVFYFWLNPGAVSRLLLLGATMALLAAIPVSISRSLMFYVVVAFLFALIATARRPAYVGPMLAAGIGGVFVLLVLSKTPLLQTAFEAFSSRFTTASDQEGGLKGTLGSRYVGGLLGALSGSLEQPFFGYGLGMGTNVGSMLLGSAGTYLISEEEWGRLVGELGPLMGLGVIFIRVGLSFKLALASYRRLVVADLLPWMLLSFCLLTLPQAQWSQPTSLGFSTLIAGLVLASMRPAPTGQASRPG